MRWRSASLPRTEGKLTSHLVSHLGKKFTEAEVSKLVKRLIHAGHLVTDDKGRITWHLDLA